MKKTLLFALSINSLLVSLFFLSCNKINLATDLGQGLIPEVDNIHTFDTTLEIETYNKLFTAANDSFHSILSDYYFLGQITNDPIFGKSDAQMYFQVLPANKSLLKNKPSTRIIDSVVLVLKYLGVYGDTTVAQNIQVAEIAQSTNFLFYGTSRDTTGYPIRDHSWLTTAGVLGSANVIPYKLKDSILDIRAHDTLRVSNQLRIKLDNAFGQRLLNYDTTGINDAYSSDSAFKKKFNGFAVSSIGGGNALMAFSLLDTTTKLAIYYRYENETKPGDMDTTVAFLYFGGTPASASYIGRDYSGTQLASTSSDDIADQILYIQNTPGTYANVKIPGLGHLPKGVIHLAELQMESIYDASDTLFPVPNNLFLDAVDTSTAKASLIPFVFSLNSNGGLMVDNFYSIPSSFSSRGQYYYYKMGPGQHPIKQWRFNITKYVQGTAMNTLPVYNFRLYAPASISLPVYKTDPLIGYFPKATYPSGSASMAIPAAGRVRIGGGNHPTQKMKLRIVYSKL